MDVPRTYELFFSDSGLVRCLYRDSIVLHGRRHCHWGYLSCLLEREWHRPTVGLHGGRKKTIETGWWVCCAAEIVDIMEKVRVKHVLTVCLQTTVRHTRRIWCILFAGKNLYNNESVAVKLASILRAL